MDNWKVPLQTRRSQGRLQKFPGNTKRTRPTWSTKFCCSTIEVKGKAELNCKQGGKPDFIATTRQNSLKIYPHTNKETFPPVSKCIVTSRLVLVEILWGFSKGLAFLNIFKRSAFLWYRVFLFKSVILLSICEKKLLWQFAINVPKNDPKMNCFSFIHGVISEPYSSSHFSAKRDYAKARA